MLQSSPVQSASAFLVSDFDNDPASIKLSSPLTDVDYLLPSYWPMDDVAARVFQSLSPLIHPVLMVSVLLRLKFLLVLS